MQVSIAGSRKDIDMCFPYRLDFFPSTWEGVGNDEGCRDFRSILLA